MWLFGALPLRVSFFVSLRVSVGVRLVKAPDVMVALAGRLHEQDGSPIAPLVLHGELLNHILYELRGKLAKRLKGLVIKCAHAVAVELRPGGTTTLY